MIEHKRERNSKTTICILLLSKFAYTCSLHCYSLYSFTISSTYDGSVDLGLGEKASKKARKRERF